MPSTRFRSHFLDHLRSVSRRSLIVIGILLLVALAVRLSIPPVLKWAINRRLEQVPAYTGRVEGVHVAIWRGAYELHGVRIAKRGVAGDPFFAAEEVACSLAWRELFRGKIVSEVRVVRAALNFIQAGSPEVSQLEADRRWQDAILDIFPVDITHFEVVDSAIHYRNEKVQPVVDVFADHISVHARGLRNRPADEGVEFPATLTARAHTIGDGWVTVTGQAEPLAAQPHFELRVIVDQVELPQVNRFLREYGKVDVSKGEFKMYFEMAARDGRFEGYVKPFFANIDFKDITDEGKSVGEKLWEAIVSGLVKIFKNKPKDELATRIPFAGEFGDTEIGLWATIRTMFRHGFIEALVPRLEDSVKTDDIEPPGTPLKPPEEKKDPGGP